MGKKVTDLHQDLIGEIDFEFIDNSTDADVLFLALPHKESKIWLENNNVGNAVVIDLETISELEKPIKEILLFMDFQNWI